MTEPSSIVTLDDVKDFIGIPSSQTSRDTVLQRYIDSATVWATYVSDAIIPTTYTHEVHSGGRPQIVLFNTPIISVASIIEYVSATSFYTLTQSEAGTNQTYGFSVDNAAAGIISRRWNGIVGDFVGGTNNVVVTYKAGFEVIPADIVVAVLSDIQVLYNLAQQGKRQGAQGGEPFSNTLPLNMFPRLEALMQSSRRTSAIG